MCLKSRTLFQAQWVRFYVRGAKRSTTGLQAGDGGCPVPAASGRRFLFSEAGGTRWGRRGCGRRSPRPLSCTQASRPSCRRAAQSPTRPPPPGPASSRGPCRPPARVGLAQPGPPRPASSREEPPTARRLRGEGLPDYRLGDRVTIELSGKSSSPSLSEEAETVPEVEGRGKRRRGLSISWRGCCARPAE